MGAAFINVILPEDTDPVEWVKQARANDQHEYGHGGYTGTWAEIPGATHVRIKPFQSEQAAEEYLLDNAEKWNDALIVPLWDGRWVVGAWASE